MLQLLNYTNIRMVEGMKNVSEQNAEATKRMAEPAEVSQRQAVHGASQAQSMAVLAYDAKRDSEVMKAITVVTIFFLPLTFVSVCPILHLKLTLSRQSSSWGSSISITTSSTSPDKVGFTSLARFRARLLTSERHLGGYGGQGRRKRNPFITLLVKRLHKWPIH